MDTAILKRSIIEKNAASAAGVGIAICILISQTLLISAKDIEIASYTGISPALNFIQEEQAKREHMFNQSIANKYIGGQITDVEKGVKHIKMLRFYNNRPVRINIVEISTDVNANLSVEPSIASAENNLATRTKISTIAERSNAIAAINGGYFKPQTGVPLGTLMINKTIYTGPIYDRVALGISDNGYAMDRVQLKANLKTNIGGLKIDNINQPRMLSTHTIVYTPSWGKYAPSTPKYGSQLAVANGKLVEISEHSLAIPEDGYVIVGPTKKLEEFAKAKNFKLDIKMNPEWSEAKHIISGGPYLIKNGDVYVDMTAQKLGAIGGRNPRTAIGYTKDNHLIMLTADGREGASVGLTLMELANLMKEFGCVNAMNLDGGGSTVMYVQGQVVNKPAVKGGIPLSHTLLVTQKNIKNS